MKRDALIGMAGVQRHTDDAPAFSKGEKMIYKLSYPPSVNNYKRIRRGGGMYLTERARIYKLTAAQQAKQILYGDVAVIIKLLPKTLKNGKPSKVVMDLDNCLKLALDVMEGVAYENDKQVKHITASYGDAVKDGGMIIEVKKI
ncbi:MAG: RusA family crossover junction endodeoxyribonuclease [Bacteroidota bacterium]